MEDTEDIVQETLLVVFRKIAEFQYDPRLSFRAWLKTVSYHKWLQAVEHNRLVYPTVAEPSTVMTYKSRVNLAVEEFKQLLDRIAEQEIFSLACTKVRSRVSERVWLCFEQSELLNQPRSELGISTGYVQVNVFRVRQLVHAEIKAIDHG